MSYEEKLKWSKELAARVTKDYTPYAVLVGYTSGGDSNIALKLASMFFDVTAAFTIDTTIAAPETLLNCEKVATEIYKMDYIVRMPPYNGIEENPYTYFELVKRHGFPGKTKTAHRWMYQYLKDHAVNRILSSFRKGKRNRNIVIISGARKDESIRRMGTSRDITIMGSNIWVNICNTWTNQDMHDFAQDNGLDQYRSPISKIMGMSGECFCGSFASKGQQHEVKIASPSTFEKIMFIQKWLNNNTTFKWDWDEGPITKADIKKAKDEAYKKMYIPLFTPEMLMCSTCMNNTATSDE